MVTLFVDAMILVKLSKIEYLIKYLHFIEKLNITNFVFYWFCSIKYK